MSGSCSVCAGCIAQARTDEAALPSLPEVAAQGLSAQQCEVLYELRKLEVQANRLMRSMQGMPEMDQRRVTQGVLDFRRSMIWLTHAVSSPPYGKTVIREEVAQ